MSRKQSRFSAFYLGLMAAVCAAGTVLGLVLTDERTGGTAGLLQTWGLGTAAALLLLAAVGASVVAGGWPAYVAFGALLLVLAGLLALPAGSSAFILALGALVLGAFFLLQLARQPTS